MAVTSNQQLIIDTDGLFEPSVADFWSLLKPRVMSLVVFTGFAGMYVAPGAVHPLVFAISLFAIAAGAGASGAINQWYDRDIDAVMTRTKTRPIPAGVMAPAEALTMGLVISALSVLLLGLAANWLAAGLLAFTIFFYAVVYTVWLKRRTPQNIVIGGAAGALPPVIGWAAVTGSLSIEPLLLFAIIFIWTPPHFWALALFMKEDYSNAGVPMLTVTHGRKVTRAHILVYTLALVPVAVGLGFTSIGGPIYLATAVVVNLRFVLGAWQIWRRPEAAAEADSYAVEKRFFRFSLLYLFVLFGALLADHVLRLLTPSVLTIFGGFW